MTYLNALFIYKKGKGNCAFYIQYMVATVKLYALYNKYIQGVPKVFI